VKNRDFSQILLEIADLLELKGETSFKVVAYRRASEALESLPEEVENLCREGRLESVPGVGKSIATKVAELCQTGRLEYLEQLKGEIPAGVVDLMQVPEVGPKKAMLLYRQLGIQSIGELEQAATEGRVRNVPGLGVRSEERILHSVHSLRQRSGRALLGTALPAARELIAAILQTCPEVVDISLCGSLRRMKSTIGDVDLLVTSPKPEGVIACFAGLPQVAEVVSRGVEKSTVLLHNGLQADLMALPPESYGSLLQHFTGSREHNVQLRGLARDQGLSLSENGFSANGAVVHCRTEAEVYEKLGLAWIPPELREGAGEIEAARTGRLPKLLELGDIRGDLHGHTFWSDGVASIEAMALAARDMGYEYVCISDHSRGLGIANGLSIERIRQQWQEVAVLNERLKPFRILTGSEVEIRADGSLDFPDEVLAELDVVVASLHSGLRQSREKITERLITAMRNPHVDIIGHPTGRVIEAREGGDLDMEAVFRAAAETGTIMEVNASPMRLDLDDVHIRRAIELGVQIAINTDSHHTDSLNTMEYGVVTARRGWAEAKDVVNALPLPDLLARLGPKG
jgi:DNA polymerase (family X)